MSPFMRHIEACNTARLPGQRRAFYAGAAHVGWVLPDLAEALAEFGGIRITPEGVRLDRPQDLYGIARTLAEAGQFRFRGEVFDVRETADGPVLAQLDRGALPRFGVTSQGVHVNGLVRRDGATWLWVARRALNKANDPGKLDHIVAGGIPAGLTPDETLIKEAAEEAAIPASLAARAVQVGRIAYRMERPEGLRRDVLTCYDLDVPEDFTPHPADGEVEGFELWPIERAFAEVRDGNGFKFNVNLVLTGLFLRLGLIAGAEAEQVRAGLYRAG